jgi:glycerol-3-phosphate acyltransferase PlsX
MQIVLDAMGSDAHPEPELEAAVAATERWGETILLVGPQDLLASKLERFHYDPRLLEIVHAPEVLKMTDKPARSARGKAQSSMAVGMDLIKTGRGEAFVSAGNTGGAMANALFRLGRIRGVKRPALGTIFPVKDGYAILIDIGANTDCRPIYLLQFAALGSVYAEIILQRESPRIGLVSNGEEPGKGNELIKETFPLLEKSGLNFIGNLEPKELFAGQADVAVTDGFTGNVLVKTSEAVAKLITQILREQLTSSPVTTLGGLLAQPALRRVKAMLDPSEYGAAPLLGVKGLVFIGHGRSDAKALINAIRVAREAVEGDLMNALETAIATRLPRTQKSEEVP